MEPGNLIWIVLGSLFTAILLLIPVWLDRRARERIHELEHALADSRKNENHATASLALEKRNREHAEAFAKVCRNELARHSGLIDALNAFAAELREADEGRHREALALAQTILAKADFLADSRLTRETELEAIATLGAQAALQGHEGLAKPEHCLLGATLGALLTMRNYVTLAVTKQGEIADERLAEDEELNVEMLDFPGGKVIPLFREERKDENEDEGLEPA